MIVIVEMVVFGGQIVKFDPSTHTTKSRTYGAPGDVAQKWLKQGAQFLYLLDLDAAIDTKRSNHTAISAVNRMALTHKAEVYAGGGIRDERRAAELLNGYGVSRVLVGTRAVRETAWAELIGRLFRERVILQLDMHRGKVAAPSLSKDGLELEDFLERSSSWATGALWFTNGPQEDGRVVIDAGSVDLLVKKSKRPVFVSGGISDADDVRRLKDAGVFGMVLGAELYHDVIRLRDAIAAAHD